MRTWTRWGVALAASAALTAVCGGAQAQNAAGDWRGTLNFNGNATPVRVTLKVKAGDGYEGSWAGPKATVALKEAKVDKGMLTFATATGSYSGRWDKARKAWVGQWSPQFQLTFIPASGAEAPSAPPASAPPPSPPPSLAIPLVLTAVKP